MFNELLELGGHQVNLVAGSGGVFEVTVEGALYSQRQQPFSRAGRDSDLLAGE